MLQRLIESHRKEMRRLMWAGTKHTCQEPEPEPPPPEPEPEPPAPESTPPDKGPVLVPVAKKPRHYDWMG